MQLFSSCLKCLYTDEDIKEESDHLSFIKDNNSSITSKIQLKGANLTKETRTREHYVYNKMTRK